MVLWLWFASLWLLIISFILDLVDCMKFVSASSSDDLLWLSLEREWLFTWNHCHSLQLRVWELVGWKFTHRISSLSALDAQPLFVWLPPYNLHRRICLWLLFAWAICVVASFFVKTLIWSCNSTCDSVPILFLSFTLYLLE